MRYLAIIVSLFITAITYAQKIDTVKLNVDASTYYHITRPGNTGVIFFLHGGVNNPAFADPKNKPGLDFLLEGNSVFIPAAVAAGFDVLIPVKDDSLNWLRSHEYCFQAISNILQQHHYTERFISGFSDGGTGSYRIFYTHSNYFDGLIVCNGYPQLQNFNKSVQYDKISGKKLLFLSTTSDNTIPYEFLLIEYCRQKKYNPDTYLYLTNGNHSFHQYTQEDITRIFDMIKTNPDNTQTTAVHAYIRHDKVITFYPFRKSTLRKFHYGQEYYDENLVQSSQYK